MSSSVTPWYDLDFCAPAARLRSKRQALRDRPPVDVCCPMMRAGQSLRWKVSCSQFSSAAVFSMIWQPKRPVVSPPSRPRSRAQLAVRASTDRLNDRCGWPSSLPGCCFHAADRPWHKPARTGRRGGRRNASFRQSAIRDLPLPSSPFVQPATGSRSTATPDCTKTPKTIIFAWYGNYRASRLIKLQGQLSRHVGRPIHRNFRGQAWHAISLQAVRESAGGWGRFPNGLLTGRCEGSRTTARERSLDGLSRPDPYCERDGSGDAHRTVRAALPSAAFCK